ncbi:protein-glutamine gamma-glutamyltransferase [Bacillus sp. FJAT-42376]|uniref:protein-glutamine gamma-glutamyltransferase n=1 Tax=Bacillus sp. FJAT-42376 TaxID=2014076 RepID=UPI000F4FC825|nr:protein-glutamine gamma-glutamyltransferase [Bacillus sp. FJAT-42376]AZB44190.1 protein-glutamine gamma-glutamyltransferase [Bacillus sp. FJAT-42376]
MIIIQNKEMDYSSLKKEAKSDVQKEMIIKMDQYKERYVFVSKDQFSFELSMRSRVIEAARTLAYNGAQFATFETSMCNPALWILTERGAFILRPGVPSSAGIRDIFQNGRLYAFECATAIVILFYKAALDSLGAQAFDRVFRGIILRDWRHDEDLNIRTQRGNDYIPGDCLYFNNPDFDAQYPQWRGENTIMMGNKEFFGHGMGLKDADSVIKSLNEYRFPGSKRSAYLLSQTTRPDFKYLYFFSPANSGLPVYYQNRTIVSRIGSSTAAV